MQYKCKTIPLNSLLINPVGIVMPACEQCLTKDCENPVENKMISIMGVSRNIKVYMRGDTAYFVVDCQGFTK